MAKHRDPRAWFKAVATFCTKAVDTGILIILQTGAAWVLLRCWAAKALAAIDLGPFFWEARLQGTNLGPFWGPRGLWIFNNFQWFIPEPKEIKDIRCNTAKVRTDFRDHTRSWRGSSSIKFVHFHHYPSLLLHPLSMMKFLNSVPLVSCYSFLLIPPF